MRNLLTFLLGVLPFFLSAQLSFETTMNVDCEAKTITFDYSQIQGNANDDILYLVMQDDNGDNIADRPLFESRTPEIIIEKDDFPTGTTTLIACLWVMDENNRPLQSKEGTNYGFEPCCEPEVVEIVTEVPVEVIKEVEVIVYDTVTIIKDSIITNTVIIPEYLNPSARIGAKTPCGRIMTELYDDIQQFDTLWLDFRDMDCWCDTTINIVSDTLLQGKFDSLQMKYDNDIAAYQSSVAQLQNLLASQKNAVGSLIAENNRLEGWVNKTGLLYDSLQVAFNEMEDRFVIMEIDLEDCQEEDLGLIETATKTFPLKIYPNPIFEGGTVTFESKVNGELTITNQFGLMVFNSYLDGKSQWTPNTHGLYYVSFDDQSYKVSVLKN